MPTKQERRYQEAIQRLGRDNVTATFGCAMSHVAEIVGPLKPKSVYYGMAFGYDEHNDEFLLHNPIPLITFSFNKYRPDLPPWDSVREFVLASRDDTGEVHEYSFIEASVRGINTTGELKTVELHAEGPSEGVDCAIIERTEVAEKRNMDETDRNLRNSQKFKVNEELF